MSKVINKCEEFKAMLENLRRMRHEIEQEHLKIKE